MTSALIYPVPTIVVTIEKIVIATTGANCVHEMIHLSLRCPAMIFQNENSINRLARTTPIMPFSTEIKLPFFSMRGCRFSLRIRAIQKQHIFPF